jgi:hypothetical protein
MGAITSSAIAYVRGIWPTADVSGEGDRWAVLRFPHSLRHNRASVIFFRTQDEARAEGAKTGDRVIEARLHVPKIPKSKELGWD